MNGIADKVDKVTINKTMKFLFDDGRTTKCALMWIIILHNEIERITSSQRLLQPFSVENYWH